MKDFLQRCYIILVLISVILFAFQGVTFAGITGKIAGKITDAETGEPLPGVNVIIPGTTIGSATDLEGDYFIINLSPGNYTVVASMIGYQTVNKTNVIVKTDRTITVNFAMKQSTISGEEVTVIAERDIVPMDVSASQFVSEGEQIEAVPLVTDIQQYISLQAGIEGTSIRGGSQDQNALMVDGLMAVDNRANKPMMMVNLSSVKELSVIKGGFNAEYGNVRSGLINVITKEGSPNTYNGSVIFRLSPPRLKHSGYSLFDPRNYYLRPYLDPAVMWVGTKNGTWDEETQKQYPEFMGWNAYSAKLLSDDDPTNDRTPEECRDLFIWRHRAEGADKLMPPDYKQKTGREHHEGKYGNKPDWNVDASFGGPVPFIGKSLGNMSFFASYRNNWEAFALPVSRDYFKEENFHLKLTSRLSPSMKLRFEGIYGETNTVTAGPSIPSSRMDYYLNSGDAVLWSPIATGDAHKHRKGYNLYWPISLNPFDIYKNMEGISFDHVLSPTTFYNLRITHSRVKNSALDIPRSAYRDTTTLRYFGNTPVDEVPYGYWYEGGYKSSIDGMLYSGIGAEMRDWSEINTINVKFDMTSQVNKYNQVKVGFLANYDDINEHTRKEDRNVITSATESKWHEYPFRFGAYIQDKIELEGMIANLGVRIDYNDPNTGWYTVDRYSKYFKREYKYLLTAQAPTEPAKGHVKISPRLGISHPISANAKLYFNYGHFYSMPRSRDMYKLDYGRATKGIAQIGNPSADLPKTVAYELGVEYNLMDLFLLRLSGYYKDVTAQTGWVVYTSYDGTINYSTTENNNYQDIRGFEFSVEKRFGRWITGWMNYNYMVSTSGYIGRKHYFQDPREQALYGLQNPYQEVPLARPVFRGYVQFAIPQNWGPTVAGIKPLSSFYVSFLYSWKAGNYMTWDPLQTYKLVNNLQWKGRSNLDMRINKGFRVGGKNFSLFMDVRNLLNSKYLYGQGFSSNTDRRNYLYSLHLPMYKEEKYKEAGFIGGNDKLGDIKSKDKPYIDMPNREFLTFLYLRSIVFGIKVDF